MASFHSEWIEIVFIRKSFDIFYNFYLGGSIQITRDQLPVLVQIFPSRTENWNLISRVIYSSYDQIILFCSFEKHESPLTSRYEAQ